MPAVELVGVPFFPQKRYQCGPAALATVLVHSGVDVTPDELVPQVYVPERHGSFQVELEAATRAYDRLPFEPEPDATTLLSEVAAGNPVLVLQNLWVDQLPKWHYAVVVGYDPQRRQVVLRSGTQERRMESLDRFLRSWQRADHWALLALRPGRIPATATAARYVAMIADNEGLADPRAVGAALAAGLAKWPDDANMTFAVANYSRMENDAVRAAQLYRRTLILEPGHVGALNNFADLLLAERCLISATQTIDTARRHLSDSSPLYPVIVATADEIATAIAERKDEDPPAWCATLTE